jgi:hypothetical protein
MQKKPAIYLLVILPILIGGALLLVVSLIAAYSRMTGIPPAGVPNLNGLLIALPALLLWIPVSLLLGNVVLFSISPLKRVAEQYSREPGRPGFRESQRLLVKVAVAVAVVSVPLIVLGFLL